LKQRFPRWIFRLDFDSNFRLEFPIGISEVEASEISWYCGGQTEWSGKITRRYWAWVHNEVMIRFRRREESHRHGRGLTHRVNAPRTQSSSNRWMYRFLVKRAERPSAQGDRRKEGDLDLCGSGAMQREVASRWYYL
jgi:hypothetical protein